MAIDYKAFIKTHHKKIIAVLSVLVVSLLAYIAGDATPKQIFECVMTLDPASIQCISLDGDIAKGAAQPIEVNITAPDVNAGTATPAGDVYSK